MRVVPAQLCTCQECKQLRIDIDDQHKIRMEAFEIKMKPIVVNEEPSRKVNSLSQCAHISPLLSGQLQDPGRQAAVRHLRPVLEAERHDLQG